jgi:3-(3-hydroxy-phenyl)propionate hydroxylase
MKNNTLPVLVAGAGPSGLATALSLGLQGVDVIVVEREPGLTVDLRAGSFHPPTTDMLVKLGCTEMLEKGIKVPVWQIRDRIDGIIAEFDLSLIASETAYPFRLHLEQHRLTPMLLQQIETRTPNVAVRFGNGLDTVEDHGERIVATLDNGDVIEAAFVIGCEGARSVVRKAIGGNFVGFTWPEKLLVASTTFNLGTLGFAGAGYIADPVNFAAVFHVPDDGPPGLWRIAYSIDPEVPDEEVMAEPEVRTRLKQVLEHTGADVDAFDLKYRSTYKVHQRVADTWHSGRMAIAGDAAHLNNPFGGLGLNGGVHDAVNIAEKLGPVWLNGGDHQSAFALYQAQRRPTNIKAVQAMSIRNKKLLEERDPAVRRQRQDEIRAISRDPVKARAFLMETSMIRSVREAAAITLENSVDAEWSGETIA